MKLLFCMVLLAFLAHGCVTVLLDEPQPDIKSIRAKLGDYYNWDFECDCWQWGGDRKKIKGKVILGQPWIEESSNGKKH